MNRFIILASFGLLACSSQDAQITTGPGAGFGEDVVAGLQRVAGGGVGGLRTLDALDLNGDATIDGTDVALFEAIANAAGARPREMNADGPVPTEIYEGPPKDTESVFKLVRSVNRTVDVTNVPPERMRELAIESYWAAGQARLAAAVNVKASKDIVFNGALHSLVAGYNPKAMDPGQLCSALDGLDVATLRDRDAPAVAIFDLDSTVWAGNVTEAFLAVLAEHDMPKPAANPAVQEFLKTVPGIDVAVVESNTAAQNAALLLQRHTDTTLPKAERVNAADAFYNIVRLLKGMTVAEAAEAARITFDEGSSKYTPWGHRIFTHEACGMREVLAKLEEKQITIYLLSATLDLLAEAGGTLLGVPRKHVMGSILEVENNVYTGKVAGSTYYNKDSITRQWLPGPPLFAFGDSPTSDFGMLLEAGSAAFMVNPRDRFVTRDQEEAGSRMVMVRFGGTVGELTRQ